MTIDLQNLQTNVPKVNLQDYFYLISGVPKGGKTTLFAKFVENYIGDVSKGLILAFEKGYTALKVNAQDIEDWDDFEEAVDQLVEQKDELPFEFIGLDTADIMWEMVQAKVIEEWNREKPSLRTQDINAVGAKKQGGQGFGVGYARAKTKIRQQIDRLMKAGYGVMAISHSKHNEVEEKSGLTYDQLIVSLPAKAREVFVNMADFIVFLTIEKEKVDDEIETKRYLYFRSDGYVEAGGRFQNIPEKIEYDVDGFITTVKDAIKAEFDEGDDVEKIQKDQEKEKKEKADEFAEKEKQQSVKEDELSKHNEKDLKDELKSLLDEVDKAQFKERIQDELDASKPAELDTKEKLYDAVQIAKSLK